MKMKNRKAIALIVVLLIVTLSASISVYAAKLNKKKLCLTVGQSAQLKVKGTRKTIKWSSSNKAVAVVSNNGKVTAKKAGKAVITAKIGKTRKTCRVTVKETSFTSLRGRAFGYNDGTYMYEAEFFKKTDSVQFGIWRGNGSGASLEDFRFDIRSNSKMILKGARSKYDYLLEITPISTKEIHVKLKCLNSNYDYFDIDRIFKLTRTFDY